MDDEKIRLQLEILGTQDVEELRDRLAAVNSEVSALASALARGEAAAVGFDARLLQLATSAESLGPMLHALYPNLPHQPQTDPRDGYPIDPANADGTQSAAEHANANREVKTPPQEASRIPYEPPRHAGRALADEDSSGQPRAIAPGPLTASVPNRQPEEPVLRRPIGPDPSTGPQDDVARRLTALAGQQLDNTAKLLAIASGLSAELARLQQHVQRQGQAIDALNRQSQARQRTAIKR